MTMVVWVVTFVAYGVLAALFVGALVDIERLKRQVRALETESKVEES
jgi:hypothetical protein